MNFKSVSCGPAMMLLVWLFVVSQSRRSTAERVVVDSNSEGPLRIRISGIQNKEDVSGGTPYIEEKGSHSMDGAFVATTANPVPARIPAENRVQSSPAKDEEMIPSAEYENDSTTASPTNTLQQLGKAIKFIGKFVSWARAINPSTEDESERGTAAAEDSYNYESLSAVATANSGSAGNEQSPQEQQQQQLRKGLIGEPRVDSGDNATGRSATGTTAVAEGRHIKGDPLKGYYDFVITEGSYKFWAVFQLATAVLIIYSTCAAIYYSKVNPIVSDYDYVDYFGGRALGSGASQGRSLTDLDNTDVVDDDGEEDEDENEDNGAHKSAQRMNATRDHQDQESNRSFLSGWTSIFEGGKRAWWIDTAASGFHFVLDAIDKMPQ